MDWCEEVGFQEESFISKDKNGKICKWTLDATKKNVFAHQDNLYEHNSFPRRRHRLRPIHHDIHHEPSKGHHCPSNTHLSHHRTHKTYLSRLNRWMSWLCCISCGSPPKKLKNVSTEPLQRFSNLLKKAESIDIQKEFWRHYYLQLPWLPQNWKVHK